MSDLHKVAKYRLIWRDSREEFRQLEPTATHFTHCWATTAITKNVRILKMSIGHKSVSECVQRFECQKPHFALRPVYTYRKSDPPVRRPCTCEAALAPRLYRKRLSNEALFLAHCEFRGRERERGKSGTLSIGFHTLISQNHFC
jgi:hypothetical protein